jgi:hypothetical protein
MAVSANSLSGFLQVYAQRSLEQFIAAMPPKELISENFSDEIANGGLSVTTRIASNGWGSQPNDLTNGWADEAASSSAITATLKLRDQDLIFNELEWATITEQVLLNTYFPQMAKQLANGIMVDLIGQVTSSVYTHTVTVNSSSLLTVTGSTSSLAAAILTLDNLEVPFDDRYAIVNPTSYQGLVSGILPTYVYGSKDAVQDYKVQQLLGCTLHRYARFYNSTRPQGGAAIGVSSDASTKDKLIGIVGNKSGLVLAVRQPVEFNAGTTLSATATDATSGLSLQTRIVADASQPAWRIAVVSVYGTAAGNPNAIVPIITASV